MFWGKFSIIDFCVGYSTGETKGTNGVKAAAYGTFDGDADEAAPLVEETVGASS